MSEVTMGQIVPIRAAGQVSTVQATREYLDSLMLGGHPKSAKTISDYRRTLRYFTDAFPGPAGELDPLKITDWFTSRWNGAANATWDTYRATYMAAGTWWEGKGWIEGNPFTLIPYRTIQDDVTSKVLSRSRIDDLLTDPKIPLRERLLWRMLYDTAARASEILSLDVPDLDPANHRATVRRKGGKLDTVTWEHTTSRNLGRYLKATGRAWQDRGPVFVAELRAGERPVRRTDLDPAGRPRLSYKQAEKLFKQSSGGCTLHQWRHSALTHLAEKGMPTSLLMAKSGHRTERVLLRRYAKPSPDAVQAWEAEHGR